MDQRGLLEAVPRARPAVPGRWFLCRHHQAVAGPGGHRTSVRPRHPADHHRPPADRARHRTRRRHPARLRAGRAEPGRPRGDRRAPRFVGRDVPGATRPGGQTRLGQDRKGSKWLRGALVQSARAASSSKGTYLSERYRQVMRRRGDAKAMVAVVSVLLKVYAKCVYGQDEVARTRIEAALAPTAARKPHVNKTSPAYSRRTAANSRKQPVLPDHSRITQRGLRPAFPQVRGPLRTWWQVKDSNLRSFRDGYTVLGLQACDQQKRCPRNNFRAYSPQTADVSRG